MITLNMLKKSHKVIDNSFINTYTVHRLIFGYFISNKYERFICENTL